MGFPTGGTASVRGRKSVEVSNYLQILTENASASPYHEEQTHLFNRVKKVNGIFFLATN